MLKRGDIVAHWTVDNRFSSGDSYGIVTKAGPKTANIRWESGNRNRVAQGRKDMRLVIDPEILAEVQPKLKE